MDFTKANPKLCERKFIMNIVTITFNPASEARSIIQRHTEAVMHCAHCEFDNERELFEFMMGECAFILTQDFLEGKYTPMEYNAIRNELAKLLNGIFMPVMYPHCNW